MCNYFEETYERVFPNPSLCRVCKISTRTAVVFSFFPFPWCIVLASISLRIAENYFKPNNISSTLT